MKRRLTAVMFAIVAVLLLAPAAARADSVGLLSVDNQHVYAGMDKSYAAGYLPVQSEGKVRIVLPLTASAEIQGSAITVTPQLGAPGSSPFVLGNYIETVTLSSQSVDDGASTVSAYLVDLSLPLASDRLRGTYLITMDVAYKDGSGSDMRQSIPLYVTVTGKGPATPSTPAPETPRHQPKVIVGKYSADPDPILTGQDFNLSFTLTNTSTSYAIYNIKVTVKSDTPDLAPADNSSTLYYSSLAKGASIDIGFPMKARPDAAAGAHGITVSVEYEDSKAVAYSASENIPVTVTQALRLEFDKPGVPAQVTAGDTTPVTMQVMNKGRSVVYNVTCTLNAPGLLPQSSSFLGDMDPGTAKTAQIMAFAGTLNMSADGTAAGSGGPDFGPSKGTITVTYEDELGKQYTETVDIATTINAPVTPTTQPEAAPPQPKASQWWISALIAAGLIIAVATVLVLGGRSRRRKVQARGEQ